jgi:hypothetical protein
MKCAILAFDALEYNFVKLFQLTNLKQKEFGKVRIPQECFVKVKTDYYEENLFEPQTPLVWFSFLTGKKPTEINFNPLRWEIDLFNILSIKTTWIQKFLRKFNSVRKLEDKIIDSLNLKKKRSRISDYCVPTIFNLTEKSYAFNVPLYSENWHGWGYGLDPKGFTSFKEFINAVLRSQLAEFNREKENVLQFLGKKKDWELFMAYFYILDVYGELCFSKPSLLSQIYSMVDDFVYKIRNRLEDAFILIVSDHGVEPLPNTPFGRHSQYAFYSTNLKLGLKNPEITDFYYLIKKILSI